MTAFTEADEAVVAEIDDVIAAAVPAGGVFGIKGGMSGKANGFFSL